MSNPVSGDKYSNKWIVDRCCCDCSLRLGCLILGWFQLSIGALLFIGNIVNGAYKSFEGFKVYEYLLLVISVAIYIVTGLALLFGVYKLNAKFVWTAACIYLCHIFLEIALTIVFFVYLDWPKGIASICVALLLFYFFLVTKSYAFEVEAGRGGPVNPARDIRIPTPTQVSFSLSLNET